MKNIFLTGKSGIGKTTLIKNILENLDTSIGGYIKEEEFSLLGKYLCIKSLYNGRDKRINCYCDKKDYYNLLNNEVVTILKDSCSSRNVIVIDEIGIFECKADDFSDFIVKTLDSDKIVLGVIENEKDEFLERIRNRDDVLLIEVTERNREVLIDRIITELKKCGVKLKDRELVKEKKKILKWYNHAQQYDKNIYQDIIISKIKEDIKDFNGLKVLHIGVGTGNLSIAFSKMGAEITAVDSSFYKIEELKKRAVRENVKKIKCILSNWMTLDYEKYDIVLCTYASSAIGSEQALKKLIDSSFKYSYVVNYSDKIYKNFNMHILNSGLGRKQKELNYSMKEIVSIIKNIGYKYRYENFTCDFNQYFSDVLQAKNFFYDYFNITSKKGEKFAKDILVENLKKYDYGFVFCDKRDNTIISILK